MIRLLIHLILYAKVITQRDDNIIRMVIFVSDNRTDLDLYIGYNRVAAAVYVAWDKIKYDQILPAYELDARFVKSNCLAYLEAGLSVDLIDQGFDVIVGPPCSSSAEIAGIVAKGKKIPMFIWGPPVSLILKDDNMFPTVVTTIHSGYDEATSLLRLLEYYQWYDIALILYVARSDLTPRCKLIVEGMESQLENKKITIVYKRALTNSTASNIQTIRDSLRLASQVSRVFLFCLETLVGRRNILLAIADEKLNLPEYVYIFIECRRSGFSDVWMDKTAIPDGLDEKALSVVKNTFILDTLPLNSSEQFYSDMKDVFVDRLNCTSCSELNSAFSSAAELADAVMAYALMLNRSLALKPTGMNGEELTLLAQGLDFQGFTGRVLLSVNKTRVPVFGLYVWDMTNKSYPMVYITENSGATFEEAFKFAQPESVIFARHGGKAPLNVPKCAYDGSLCPPPFFEQYWSAVLGGFLAFLLIVILIVSGVYYVIRNRRKEEERQNKMWQIEFSSLTLPDYGSGTSTSSRSLQSTITSTTRVSHNSMKETEQYAFYVFGTESLVARKHKIQPLVIRPSMWAELRKLRAVDHDNLCAFTGLSVEPPFLLSLWKFCSRGSLKNVIAKGGVQMDWFFKFSLIRDIAEALHYLHHSSFGPHGWLSSSCCLVNDRWQVNVSLYGLTSLKSAESRPLEELLWTAPELLRDTNLPFSTAGDIFSFAIICAEVITKKSPWDLENQDYEVDELLHMIRSGGREPYRPSLETDEECNSSLIYLVKDCWLEEPQQRPTVDQIKSLIKGINENKSQNLMDHAFHVLEQYATNLEEEVQVRMKELTEEKKKSDILLYRMLPRQVADKLKTGQSVEPEAFESVTLFFSDVVSFTTLAGRSTPHQVVNLLNDLYTIFDAIINEHDVYKVETIGDGYLCVSGLPHRNGNQHAKDVAEMSKALLRAIETFRVPHLPKERIQIRIGLHTGSVVAGVVGITMPRYCLFGDAVNVASRMESNGKPGKIHVSEETARYLTQVIGGYKTEVRGEVILKGKGAVTTHWLIIE